MSTTGTLVLSLPDALPFSARLASQGTLILPAAVGGVTSAPPVATLVSPLAGVSPGAVGGFSSDPYVAKYTPVIVQVTDLDLGVQYAVVVVRFTGTDNTEEVVYRRGAFRGRYLAGSVATTITNGLQLSIARDGGWPAGAQLVFDVDATDKAGNLDA